MPPLPILPDVYRVALKWTDSTYGGTAVNVMHFQSLVAGVGTPTDLNTALSSTFVANQWLPVVTSAFITEVDILPLDGTSATSVFTYAGLANMRGGGTGDPLRQVCVLVKNQTGHRGRANRGRTYLPLIAEGAVQNGLVPGTTVTSMNAAWSSFLAAITSNTPNGYTPGVAAYGRGPVSHTPHFTPTVGFVTEAYCGTQRRRQPRP